MQRQVAILLSFVVSNTMSWSLSTPLWNVGYNMICLTLRLLRWGQLIIRNWLLSRSTCSRTYRRARSDQECRFCLARWIGSPLCINWKFCGWPCRAQVQVLDFSRGKSRAIPKNTRQRKLVAEPFDQLLEKSPFVSEDSRFQALTRLNWRQKWSRSSCVLFFFIILIQKIVRPCGSEISARAGACLRDTQTFLISPIPVRHSPQRNWKNTQSHSQLYHIIIFRSLGQRCLPTLWLTNVHQERRFA